MKMSEIVIDNALKGWDILSTNDNIAEPVYELYKMYKHKTKNFTISADRFYDEYKITDIIVDLHDTKKKLLSTYDKDSQIIKVVERLLSYFEYNELY
jgi:hypothetical protein